MRPRELGAVPGGASVVSRPSPPAVSGLIVATREDEPRPRGRSGRGVRRLDAELTAAHGMALVEYEVLFTLFRADGRLRMSQLAERASLSRSGLSRVVDVLEHQRLVRRRPDADDGRAVVATLTPLGRQRLERCRLRLLDQRFADRPISTLAFDAGFGDLRGFNRAFKAKYGLSPRQLRSAAGPPGASRS